MQIIWNNLGVPTTVCCIAEDTLTMMLERNKSSNPFTCCAFIVQSTIRFSQYAINEEKFYSQRSPEIVH